MQKMPFPNINANIFLQSAAPVSFLIMGFEVIFKMKFSCLCIIVMNQFLALLILTVPAVFASVMISLFLSFIISESSGSSEAQGNNEQFNRMISLIPPALWICIFFIDGDYCACGFTYWDGQYVCDTSLHPSCFSWCKPEGTNGTGKYNYTLWVNNITKVNTKYFLPHSVLRVSCFVREE